MRCLAAAAAARSGASQVVQAGVAQLSTSAPAASLWRQALAAAAAALGGTPAASGSVAAAAVQPAAAEPLLPQQDAAQQQLQGQPAQEEQHRGRPDAWRRGAEFSSGRRQREGPVPVAAAPLASLKDGSSSKRSSRRARRLEKQWPPEAYAAAAGKQLVAPAAGENGGSDGSGSKHKGKAGGKRGGTSALPSGGGAGDDASVRPSGSSRSAVARSAALSSSEAVDLDAQEACSSSSSSSSSACPLPPTRILQDDAHPIRETDISRAAWLVLSRLRAAGHEVYVVGGTVRDLLLGGTPKDFDILTSAEPHQVKRLFSRCIIVGRAFPVCQVFTEGTMIEVTSFSTQADTRLIPVDASVHMIGRQKSKDAKWRREGATWAEARASNASRRDFTVNGLLYEPFSRLLFDSVGGLEDCNARRLRTICPPAESFATDPARILRGVRLAARASLELDPATAAAMEDNAAAIGQLPQGRLQMELTSLLGYGASERSLLLMWRLGLLDMLLPQHALYLRRHKVPRAPRSRSRSRRPELLFELAAELDKHVHPQRPVDPCVWVALLAAPLVVDRISELWKQAHPGRAHASMTEQQAAEAGAAGAAASASVGDSQPGGGMDEGSSGSSAAEEGSARDVGSGSTGGSGSDGEGDGGLLPDGQPQQQPVSNEEAWRREFVDPYQQIVWEVLDSMLLPLDADTMQQLGRQAKKHSAQLRQTVGGKRRRRGGGGAADGAAPSSVAPERPLLPSVLTRPSIERAASLLMMEAELRGRPELQALLERSDWPGKLSPAFRHNGEAGGDSTHSHAQASEQQQQEQQPQSEGQQSQQQHGRHSLHHTLWQRLERAAGGSSTSSGGGPGSSAHGEPAGSLSGSSGEQGGAAADAQAEAEAALVPESLPRKLRKRRALSPEERLVLGILSDPRFDYRGRTRLPPAAPQHEPQ